MLWPLLTLFVAIAAVGLHLWWRSRFSRVRQQAEGEIDQFRNHQKEKDLENRSRQAALFDSMVEGVVLVDASGRVQLANRACVSLFGLIGQMEGKSLMEVFRLHELAEVVESVGARAQLVARELRVTRPVERWVEINGTALISPSGARIGTMLVFHDVTRLKQLERTREEFVANVSHELRTPLSLIKGYAETLLDGAKDNPAVAGKFIQIIDRNAERLRLLIEDLLTISEIESGRVRLNLAAVRLPSLVDKVLSDFAGRAEARRVRLDNQAPDLTLRADPERLEQVLGNLVGNAVKYGRSDGHVTVSATMTSAGQAEVTVQDDGPGIPKEALERVFERFYRVDKARSREEGGTGLGLAIVKHIVQSHGGKVWVKSEPGQGAAFSFTVPIDTAHQA